MWSEALLWIVAALAGLFFVLLLGASATVMSSLLLAVLALVFTVAVAGLAVLRQLRLLRADLRKPQGPAGG